GENGAALCREICGLRIPNAEMDDQLVDGQHAGDPWAHHRGPAIEIVPGRSWRRQSVTSWCYSTRSALTGSTRAARHAGTNAAITATARRTRATSPMTIAF